MDASGREPNSFPYNGELKLVLKIKSLKLAK